MPTADQDHGLDDALGAMALAEMPGTPAGEQGPCMIVHVEVPRWDTDPLATGPGLRMPRKRTVREVVAIPVAASITRMTDLCRAIGILEAWQSAACLGQSALLQIDTTHVRTMVLDHGMATVNGSACSDDDASARALMHKLETIRAYCADPATLVFVARASPTTTITPPAPPAWHPQAEVVARQGFDFPPD